MSSSEHEYRFAGLVIPFHPRPRKRTELEVSTIAALVAVNILHDADESPEEKLLSLIEATGEAEVIDASDALDALDDTSEQFSMGYQASASNDNRID
jgi:hypothetical protein